jgi:hypothetical protein
MKRSVIRLKNEHKPWLKERWYIPPKHGSWHNMAKIQLSALSRQCLDQRIPDQASLSKEFQAWVYQRNSLAFNVQWHFTAA